MSRIQTKKFAAASNAVNESVGTGDNTLVNFSVTLANKPVVPGSVLVKWTDGTAKTATDNGKGVLTGAGLVSGTINYLTGALVLDFTGGAPDNATAITCSYSYALVGPFQVTAGSTGVTGAAGVTVYEGFLPKKHIVPGSVTFSINFSSSPVTFTEDKLGKLTGSNLSSGFINYFDGYFKFYFSTPPDVAAMTCTYKHRDTETHEEVVAKLADDINTISIQSRQDGAVKGFLYSSPDEVTYTAVDYFNIPAGATAKVFAVETNKAYRVVSTGDSLEVVATMV